LVQSKNQNVVGIFGINSFHKTKEMRELVHTVSSSERHLGDLGGPWRSSWRSSWRALEVVLEIFLEVGSARAEPWRDLQKQSFGDPQSSENKSNQLTYRCRYASRNLRLIISGISPTVISGML
jgi:hypothetical protein